MTCCLQVDEDLRGEGHRPEDELRDHVGQSARSAVLLHVVHGDVAVGRRLPDVEWLLLLLGLLLRAHGAAAAAAAAAPEGRQGAGHSPGAEQGGRADALSARGRQRGRRGPRRSLRGAQAAAGLGGLGGGDEGQGRHVEEAVRKVRPLSKIPRGQSSSINRHARNWPWRC